MALSLARLVPGVPGAFLAVGLDADVDTAFDDAVSSAWYEFGHSGAVPSIADIEPGAIDVVGSAPRAQSGAELVAVRALHEGAGRAGRVWAVPVCADTALRRRRLNLSVTDPDLELPPVGVADCVPATLEQALLTLAGDAAPAADEHLEAVEVRRARARYKPVTTAHPGRNRTRFVVTTDTDPAVLAIADTAGAARRDAVAIVKAGPLDGCERYTLNVVAAARRDDGSPIAAVERVRVAQRAAVRVTLAALKAPERTKTVGWLFYGLR